MEKEKSGRGMRKNLLGCAIIGKPLETDKRAV